jgi:hypothetical protein
MKIIPQVDKEGGVGMEDAAGFFANVFGGERFRDWVCVLAILFTAADLTMPTDWRYLSHEGDNAVDHLLYLVVRQLCQSPTPTQQPVLDRLHR